MALQIALVDYPLAVDNISRWAKRAGHAVTAEKVSGSEWRLVLVKG